MRLTPRNIAAYMLAKLKIALGEHNRIIEKCKEGELILSLYTHKMDSSQLRKIIHWLKVKGISFITLDELNDIIRDEVKTPKGKAILTFDDGWDENIKIVAMAEKMCIPISIFLTVTPVEEGEGFWWSYIKKAKSIGLRVNPVEWYKNISNEDRVKQIDDLKRLIRLKREAMTPSTIIKNKKSNWVKFGAHTLHHPILTKCDHKTVKDEILFSKDKIQAWTGYPVKYFAYPNGEYGDREIKILKESGFELAFTTEGTYLNAQKTDPYKIPRCEILEHASLAENICRLTGIWFKKRIVI